MAVNITLWDTLPNGRLLLAKTDDRAVLATRRASDVVDRDLSWLDASWIEDISRDGSSILFTEMGQGGGGPGSAYIRGTDGSPAIRLTGGQAYALSPDSRWAICAASTTNVGALSPVLQIVPTGAGDARQIAGDGLAFTGARWLPNGDQAVVAAVEPDKRMRLYRLDLRQGRPEPITPEGVVTWVVSPDGSLIAVTGIGKGIQIYPVDGSAPRALPGMSGTENPIAWINDGVLINPLDGSTPMGEVRLVNPTTGQQTRWADILPQDRAGIMVLVALRATPDGRTRAYTWHRALSDLYLADGLQ
jgi:hypothetical protein